GRAGPVLAREAAGLLTDLVAAVCGGRRTGPLHRHIAAAWRASRIGEDAVRRALVLCADHELNASTFAVRVAASTGASLAACALAGLSALTGPLHGGMTAHVAAFLDDVRAERDRGSAFRRWLDRGRGLP